MSPVLQILQGISSLSAEDQEGLVQLLLSQQRERMRLRLLEREQSKSEEAVGQDVEQVLRMSMTDSTESVPVGSMLAPSMRGVDLMLLALKDLFIQKGGAVHKAEWFRHMVEVAAARGVKAPASSTFQAYLYAHAHHDKWESMGGGMFLPTDSEKESWTLDRSSGQNFIGMPKE